LNEPKAFQLATIDAAWQQLTSNSGPKRFMVADEVGLGKTIVAQQIVRRFLDAKNDRPIVAFYVCGSLPLASQNSKKLLEVLPNTEERRRARSSVDRLTMIPLAPLLTSRHLHLYAITPGTSLPKLRGPGYGRKEERALLYVLLSEIHPDLIEHVSHKMFQGAVRYHQRFTALVQSTTRILPHVWHGRFRAAVREVLKIQSGRRLKEALIDLPDRKLLFKQLRVALALAAFDHLQPDLIVFDEFQGYSERLTATDESLLVKHLRGDTDERPAARLLLSATPYKMHVTREEDPGGTEHQKNLLQLLGYLFGANLPSTNGTEHLAACREAFRDLHVELWAGRPDSDRAARARETLEALLGQVMSRTERFLHSEFWDKHRFQTIRAPIEPIDIQSFVAFAKKSNAYLDRSTLAGAVALWSSVPLPLQTLGPGYQIHRKMRRGPWPRGTPQLRDRAVKHLQPVDLLPHPRLRALSARVPPNKLALPWLAPSFPWWRLGHRWETGIDGKLLLFSHFRATPPAVAALLSYGVETAFSTLRNQSGARVQKKRYFRVTGKSGFGLVALFHPSEWLISATDPTQIFEQGNGISVSSKDVEKLLIRQVRRAVRVRGISIRRRKSRRPLWKLLARIESGESYPSCWMKIAKNEAGLNQVAYRWRSEGYQEIPWISESELRALAQHALHSPGVMLGRAVRRHSPEASYSALFRAAWIGLRKYLDRPWFVAALVKRDQSYSDALKAAVVDGNLESVLDEHLWLEGVLSPPTDPDELSERLLLCLSRVSGGAHFQRITHRLRCHAAMPFSTTSSSAPTERADDSASRPDEIRRSFNSPFWPHVLTTTSVGQEGLDFHYWCRTVVHWDLCSSPVELEQREGRVQRFAGLNVRRAIAKEAFLRGLSVRPNRSPWTQLEEWANQTLSDESGLSPWWLSPHAKTECLVFETPGSEQIFKRERLQRRRLLYRLTLGQPNQADLLESLSSRSNIWAGSNESDTIRRVRDSLLNLSPYGIRQRKAFLK
jgi:hypothetical protein